MFFRSVLVLLTAWCVPALAGETPKLSATDRATFCGLDGHEASASYALAVSTEVTWRIASGARSAKEALAKMRQAYCVTNGGPK